MPKPMSSYDYRMYLIHNADKLIKHNRSDAAKRMTCLPCTTPSTEMPLQHYEVCNSKTCAFPINNAEGLGVGRKFGGEHDNYRDQPKGCAVGVQDMNLYPISGHVGDNFELLTGATGVQGGWPTR
jgi:hypothetical protein